jgi:hypothetical protein
MRRRRVIPRGLRRQGLPARPLGARARRLLLQAHQFLAAGQQDAAADIFEQLAEGARQRDLPQYPQLLLQAGRANILSGATDRGTAQIKTAFEFLLTHGREAQVRRLAPGVRTFLQSHELDSTWKALEQLLHEAKLHIDSGMPAPAEAGRLPSKCPYCGGTLNPAEVEWALVGGAICTYCGSVVQGED